MRAQPGLNVHGPALMPHATSLSYFGRVVGGNVSGSDGTTTFCPAGRVVGGAVGLTLS